LTADLPIDDAKSSHWTSCCIRAYIAGQILCFGSLNSYTYLICISAAQIIPYIYVLGILAFNSFFNLPLLLSVPFHTPYICIMGSVDHNGKDHTDWAQANETNVCCSFYQPGTGN
jgi:hypothetical protein